MNFDNIIAKLITHPWIIAVLVLSFLGCNFIAWVRIRRESSKDYRRPSLPRN